MGGHSWERYNIAELELRENSYHTRKKNNNGGIKLYKQLYSTSLFLSLSIQDWKDAIWETQERQNMMETELGRDLELLKFM